MALPITKLKETLDFVQNHLAKQVAWQQKCNVLFLCTTCNALLWACRLLKYQKS